MFSTSSKSLLHWLVSSSTSTCASIPPSAPSLHPSILPSSPSLHPSSTLSVVSLLKLLKSVRLFSFFLSFLLWLSSVCLFFLPLCPRPGVETLVLYFSDTAWYGCTFFYIFLLHLVFVIPPSLCLVFETTVLTCHRLWSRRCLFAYFSRNTAAKSSGCSRVRLLNIHFISLQTPETTSVLLFDLKSLFVICPVEMRCAERVRKRDESEGKTLKHCKTIMSKTASIASFQCEVDKEKDNLTEEVLMRLFWETVPSLKV